MSLQYINKIFLLMFSFEFVNFMVTGKTTLWVNNFQIITNNNFSI